MTVMFENMRTLLFNEITAERDLQQFSELAIIIC